VDLLRPDMVRSHVRMAWTLIQVWFAEVFRTRLHPGYSTCSTVKQAMPGCGSRNHGSTYMLLTSGRRTSAPNRLYSSRR
jgi:hypothetical protein